MATAILFRPPCHLDNDVLKTWVTANSLLAPLLAYLVDDKSLDQTI
jgi:hypothetical protein